MAISILQMLTEQRRHGNGTSKGAAFRRGKQIARRGTLHTGRPGDTVQIGGASYFVARDGSFRRQQ